MGLAGEIWRTKQNPKRRQSNLWMIKSKNQYALDTAKDIFKTVDHEGFLKGSYTENVWWFFFANQAWTAGPKNIYLQEAFLTESKGLKGAQPPGLRKAV